MEPARPLRVAIVLSALVAWAVLLLRYDPPPLPPPPVITIVKVRVEKPFPDRVPQGDDMVKCFQHCYSFYSSPAMHSTIRRPVAAQVDLGELDLHAVREMLHRAQRGQLVGPASASALTFGASAKLVINKWGRVGDFQQSPLSTRFHR